MSIYQGNVPIIQGLLVYLRAESSGTTRSRPFQVGRRPDNLEAILSVTRDYPAFDGHPVFPYDDLTGGARSGGSRSSGPRSSGPRSSGPRSSGPRSGGLAELLWVSPCQEYLDAIAPVMQYYWDHFSLSSDVYLTSDDPDDIRATLADAYNQWDGLGFTPHVMFIGENYEDPGHERYVMGSYYTPDSTGICYYTDTCVKDALLVDFDGDELPDLPYVRVPAHTLEEVNNAVTTCLLWLENYDALPSRVMIMDGDLNEECEVIQSVHDLSLWVEGQYQDDGYDTFLLHDSDFEPCWDMQIRQDAAVNGFAQHLVEVGSAFAG